MTRPLVSVLIRVRDEADVLDRTLRALRDQVLADGLDVVVIDNESADGSARVALEGGARVFTLPRALFGYGRALNLGMELCRGDIVILLSAHSIPETDTWVRGLIGPLRAGTAGAAFCRQVPPGPLPRSQLGRFAWFPSHPLVMHKGRFTQQCAAGRDPYDTAVFSNSASAIRRDLALRYPFRDLPYSEDRAFVIDYVMAGGTVAYLPDTAVAYDRQLSWKTAYQAQFRWQISRHLIRELAASYTGHRFPEAKDNLRTIFRAAWILPAACREFVSALTAPRGLRRPALRQVPRTMAATLGAGIGVFLWKRHRVLTGHDPVLMRAARERCTRITAGPLSDLT